MRIAGIAVQVFRHPVATPVVTSFGTMRDRPAVFLRVEDETGAFGWGEIWANWPSVGAEHRARLLIADFAGLLIGRSFAAPSEAFHHLEAATRIRALQAGEWGPYRQVVAGIDTAMHDLFARRLGLPLRRMLNPAAPDAVPAYASGIHIRAAREAIARSRELGFRRFKLKVGFDPAEDLRDLRACLATLEPGEALMIDANQGWSTEAALRFTRELAGSGIVWVEEPIPADAPPEDWARLGRDVPLPLAGGENIAGFADFAAAIAGGRFTYYQPDVAKWGGVTGCAAVGRDAVAAGRVYCPHFLGGVVGLRASGELLAAVGGPGVLEVDVNPNPLRDTEEDLAARIRHGDFLLPDTPGLGLEDPTRNLQAIRTLALSA